MRGRLVRVAKAIGWTIARLVVLALLLLERVCDLALRGRHCADLWRRSDDHRQTDTVM